MKTIGHHFIALKWTIEQFSKGKYLLYFIPGIGIALAFGWINAFFENFGESSSADSFLGKIYSGAGVALSATSNFIMVFLILTVLSPINTFLSEAVDNKLTGKTVGFDLIRFVNDLIRMVFVVIIAITLELFFSGVWWLFSKLLPVSDAVHAQLSTAASFLIASFFYGFSFYDYSLERYEIGIGGSYRFCKKYFLPTLTSGVLFMILYNIPKVGIAIAPVITTIVSTFVFLKSTGRLDQIDQQKAAKEV